MANEFSAESGGGDWNRRLRRSRGGGSRHRWVTRGRSPSLLESRFGYEVILRCDGEATRESLRALLYEGLPHQMYKESRLLFYFAGHSVAQDSAELEGPRGFLVPQDAGPTVDTHLPMEEVREALVGLPCRHLLVVLDCCFAGSFHSAGMRPHLPDASPGTLPALGTQSGQLGAGLLRA